MLNKSRIIRSMVAIIIVILNIAIALLCANGLKNTSTNMNIYIKLIYIVFCIITVLLYSVLKKRLKEKILNDKLIYFYRYIYLTAIIFLSRFIMSYISGITFGGRMAVQMLITLINVIMIKRIVFNISTSDILSAIAAIIYIFLPQTLFEKELLVMINYRLTFILVGILLLLKIIDEVSQHRLKNKKYIYLSLILSVCIGINTFFGGTCITWILVIFVALAASKNIDFTHISFGQKFIDSISSIKLKRLVYKIERININKLFVVLLIVTVFTTIMQITIRYILDKELIFSLCNYSTFVERLYGILKYSRSYYIIIVTITIITEIISIILRRKIDLKTTVIRMIYVMLVLNLLISGATLYISQIFDTVLILNLILNISNIYYNREEKIKLLKEKN